MDSMKELLDTHFSQEVLTCASQLQSDSPCDIENKSKSFKLGINDSEKFGEELLKCIEGLPASQVIDWQVVTCL